MSKKNVVKSQRGLEKFLHASTANEFIDIHSTQNGTILIITRNGKLISDQWETYYSGEVEEETLREMLDFINQKGDTEARSPRTSDV
jgi:hypothetical protein